MKSYRKIQIKKIDIVFKVIIAIVIISLMTSSILFTPHNSLIGQTLEEELQQIKKDREAAQKKIEDAKKQEQAYLKQVNEVETQLLSSLSQLDELNAKLAQAKSDVDKTTIDLVLKEQELKKIEDELDGKVAILNNRVASIYKNGSGNILVILFKAQDFIEFISRLKLMTLLASQDAKIIQEIKDKRSANLNIKKGILDLRDKQKEYKNDVDKLVSQAEKKNSEIEGIYNEKNRPAFRGKGR